MLRALLFIIIAFTLSACGASKYTPYSKWSLPAHGYSEAQLDSTTYQVSYVDPSADVSDRFALYRAAELTKQRGFDYFIVADTQPSSTDDDLSKVTKTVRMYKGDAPADNPQAYNAISMLAVMGPSVNR